MSRKVYTPEELGLRATFRVARDLMGSGPILLASVVSDAEVYYIYRDTPVVNFSVSYALEPLVLGPAKGGQAMRETGRDPDKPWIFWTGSPRTVEAAFPRDEIVGVLDRVLAPLEAEVLTTDLELAIASASKLVRSEGSPAACTDLGEQNRLEDLLCDSHNRYLRP